MASAAFLFLVADILVDCPCRLDPAAFEHRVPHCGDSVDRLGELCTPHESFTVIGHIFLRFFLCRIFLVQHSYQIPPFGLALFGGIDPFLQFLFDSFLLIHDSESAETFGHPLVVFLHIAQPEEIV